MSEPSAKAESQFDKFKEAARELGTDDDPERFDERMKQLLAHRPEKKPEPERPE